MPRTGGAPDALCPNHWRPGAACQYGLATGHSTARRRLVSIRVAENYKADGGYRLNCVHRVVAPVSLPVIDNRSQLRHSFVMRLLTHFLICALLALAPSTASARWIEARSPNFVVYSDGDGDSLRRSVRLLEDYDRLLRTLTGTTAPPSASPLKVYLVSSAARLNQVEPVSSGVLGFYRARRRHRRFRGAW